MSRPTWIIVSFDGTRERIMGGKRGGQRTGPAKPIGTLAIPLDSIRVQIEAAGYVLVQETEPLHTVTDNAGTCTLPCPACQRVTDEMVYTRSLGGLR